MNRPQVYKDILLLDPLTSIMLVGGQLKEMGHLCLALAIQLCLICIHFNAQCIIS